MTIGESKNLQFVMRLSKTEKSMLVALAERSGLSGADIVRQLVRGEYLSHFGATKVVAKSKRR